MHEKLTALRLRVVGIPMTLLIAVSCQHWEPLVEQDFEMSPRPTLLHFSKPYKATGGPTRELCLAAAEDQDVARIAPTEAARRSSPIIAVLIRDSGERDTIGYHDDEPSAINDSRSTAPVVDIYDEKKTVCVWDHGLNNPADNHLVTWDRDSAGRIKGSSPPKDPLPALERKYVAIELSSRVPLRIRRARFWAGQRRAFL
jgi:hypothetical protein